MRRVLKLKYLYSDWRGAFHTSSLAASECRVYTRVNQSHRKMAKGARVPTTSKWHCWREHHLPLANCVRPDDWLWFRWKPPLWSIRPMRSAAISQVTDTTLLQLWEFALCSPLAPCWGHPLHSGRYRKAGTIYIDSTIPFTERNMPMSCCNILKWLLLFVCLFLRQASLELTMQPRPAWTSW